jgi:Icc protein
MDTHQGLSREGKVMATAECNRASSHAFTIAQISDLHFGTPQFSPDLLVKVITEVNDLQPDLVVVSGDLTLNGYRQEFMAAKECLDRIACPDLLIVPGNHDSQNAGYLHFAELIGPRRSVFKRGGNVVVGLDSTQPDLGDGRVGRSQYDWIQEQLLSAPDLRVLVLHHHLLPVPQTGRERNICYDAGDVLQLLLHCEADLVLSGHKHVPHAWTLNGLTAVTAGTACSSKMRGVAEPSYNVIRSDGERLTVWCRSSR